MDEHDDPEDQGTHHVSGTIPQKIVEKQLPDGSLRSNCSTQLSHNRVRKTGLSSSNQDYILAKT